MNLKKGREFPCLPIMKRVMPRGAAVGGGEKRKYKKCL